MNDKQKPPIIAAAIAAEQSEVSLLESGSKYETTEANRT